MKLVIDVNAPIVPGLSAAGLSLGTKLEDIEPASLSKLTYEIQSFPWLNNVSPWHIYTSADLYLRFIDGALNAVGVMKDYKGTIRSCLGIGTKVSVFEIVLGKLIEGCEDELTFERVEGQMWIEVDENELDSSNWRQVISDKIVQGIFVC